MVKVLAHWQKADWMTREEVCKELKRLFHTARSFGAELEVIDEDNSLDGTGCKFSFRIFSSTDEAISANSNFVLLEPLSSNPNSVSLPLYDHKKDATYVIWSEYGTTPFRLFPKADRLSIPTLSAHPLWAVVATGIVLHDRMVKWQ